MEVEFMSAAHDKEACEKIAKTFEGFLKQVKK